MKEPLKEMSALTVEYFQWLVSLIHYRPSQKTIPETRCEHNWENSLLLESLQQVRAAELLVVMAENSFRSNYLRISIHLQKGLQRKHPN